MKKLETSEGVHRALTASPHTPRILTGDLNTPHTERADGTIRYWQHSCPAPLRPELEARWLAAERSIIEGLREPGFTDAYRSTHGPNGAAFSWEHGVSGHRYRYDHVLASREFTANACTYLHEFRLNANHHAGILAELARD
jgi:exonuclease III